MKAICMLLTNEDMELIQRVARQRRVENGNPPDWNLAEEVLGTAAEVAFVKTLGLNPETWPFVMPIEQFRAARDAGWKDVGNVEIKAFTPGKRRSIIIPSKAMAENVPYVGAEVDLPNQKVTFKGWVMPSDVVEWGIKPEIRRADFTVGNYFFDVRGPVRKMSDLVIDIPDNIYFKYLKKSA